VVDSTPAGQQVLTLFQCEKLEVHHVSVLESALALLANHARLAAAVNQAASGRTNALLNLPANTTVPQRVISERSPEGSKNQ
jgi:hypothetical protein